MGECEGCVDATAVRQRAEQGVPPPTPKGAPLPPIPTPPREWGPVSPP